SIENGLEITLTGLAIEVGECFERAGGATQREAHVIAVEGARPPLDRLEPCLETHGGDDIARPLEKYRGPGPKRGLERQGLGQEPGRRPARRRPTHAACRPPLPSSGFDRGSRRFYGERQASLAGARRGAPRFTRGRSAWRLEALEHAAPLRTMGIDEPEDPHALVSQVGR